MPNSTHEYISNRVAEGNSGNTGEFIRELVWRDQEEQTNLRRHDLVEGGLASGPGRLSTEVDEMDLLAIARGEID